MRFSEEKIQVRISSRRPIARVHGFEASGREGGPSRPQDHVGAASIATDADLGPERERARREGRPHRILSSTASIDAEPGRS